MESPDDARREWLRSRTLDIVKWWAPELLAALLEFNPRSKWQVRFAGSEEEYIRHVHEIADKNTAQILFQPRAVKLGDETTTPEVYQMWLTVYLNITGIKVGDQTSDRFTFLVAPNHRLVPDTAGTTLRFIE